jgi:MFS family permease
MKHYDWLINVALPLPDKNFSHNPPRGSSLQNIDMSSAAEKSSHASASNPAIVTSNNVAPRRSNPVAKFAEDWLIVPKMLYFGLNVVIYSTHAFIFQYLEGAWLIKKSQFSLTNFVQFTNIAGSFFFSRLADRTGKYRLIISGCVAAYCCCMCLLLFPIFLDKSQEYLKLGYYLLINACCFFFTAGTFPLLDSMVMSKLSSNPNLSKEMFGRQRLWGTIGHCIIGVIVHELYEIAGNDYKVMFYTLIVSSVLFIIAVFIGIPGDLKVEAHSHGHHAPAASTNKEASKEASKEAVSPVAASGPRPTAFSLMTSPAFSFFLGTVLVAGFIRAIITTYQSPYITNELFLKKSVVSGSIFIRVFPEVTLYFFSKEISQWFGIYWVLLIGHAAGVIRMFGYTLIPQAAKEDSKPSFPIYCFILALECLKGANSSLVISSAARIASDMAPKGMASTAQGLVAGTWQGLSMTIGALSGYFMVEASSIKTTFLISSIAGAICIGLILAKFAVVDRVILIKSRKTIA